MPRVISTISISSKPSAGEVVPAPTASTPDLVSAVASNLDPQVAASLPPPAPAPVPIPASPEPKATGAIAPAAREQVSSMPGLAPPVLTAESVPPPVSAPVPVPASSEPIETAVTASAAPTPCSWPASAHGSICAASCPQFRCQYRLPRSRPRLRWPRRLHLRPFLACRCSRQHLCRHLARLRCLYRLHRTSRRSIWSLSVQMTGVKQIHRGRPRQPQTPRHPPQQG